MEMFTKVIGLVIKQMDMVFTRIKMGHSIRDNGKKINRMEKVKKHGLMGLCTMAITYLVKSMVKAHLYGQMDRCTLDSFKITILKALVNTSGLMEERLMEIGRTIKCMEEEYSHGQTVESMKVNILKIKNKDMEHSFGLMAGNMSDNGPMENNMEKVHSLL